MLAVLVVQHYRSAGPRYSSTRGARIVRYGTTIALVPSHHGPQLRFYESACRIRVKTSAAM